MKGYAISTPPHEMQMHSGKCLHAAVVHVHPLLRVICCKDPNSWQTRIRGALQIAHDVTLRYTRFATRYGNVHGRIAFSPRSCSPITKSDSHKEGILLCSNPQIWGVLSSLFGQLGVLRGYPCFHFELWEHVAWICCHQYRWRYTWPGEELLTSDISSKVFPPSFALLSSAQMVQSHWTLNTV